MRCLKSQSLSYQSCHGPFRAARRVYPPDPPQPLVVKLGGFQFNVVNIPSCEWNAITACRNLVVNNSIRDPEIYVHQVKIAAMDIQLYGACLWRPGGQLILKIYQNDNGAVSPSGCTTAGIAVDQDAATKVYVDGLELMGFDGYPCPTIEPRLGLQCTLAYSTATSSHNSQLSIHGLQYQHTYWADKGRSEARTWIQ